MTRTTFAVLAGAIGVLLGSAPASTQNDLVDPASASLPNPNPTVIKGWGELPNGRSWGSTAGVDIGPDGHVWAYDRCGTNSCADSSVDPIVKFDRTSGRPLQAFGGGMIVFPHGIHVDRDGNVWITDGQANKAGTIGHQVIKFSPDGKVLLRLGTAGKPGGGPTMFNEPADVITSSNGDIFVADGHSGQNDNATPATPGRIVKFSKDGTFIKEWGKWGAGPGEFKTPHSLAFDSRGRLFVADRGNHRIQIFDQQGTLLDQWRQFSRVSGLYIRNDVLYAIDSETNATRHPGWKTGIRIGITMDGIVRFFIPPHDNGQAFGAAGEGVAVDPDGNVFAAEGPISRPVAGGGLTKYVKR